MDEFKILFWIVVLVIYLLTRKKKQKPQQSAPSQPEAYEEQAPKPLTFEELLKEIQASKQQAPPKPEAPATPAFKTVPAQRPAQPRDYQDYDDEIEPDEKDLEDTQYDYKKKDDIYEVYENAKKEAFVKPSLEETLKLEDIPVKFGQFKEYEQAVENTKANEILKEFHDPEGFKKAFIMSEVLKRKF